MLHMCNHVSAGFFRCDVLFLQGKHNVYVFHHIFFVATCKRIK